MRIVSLLPSATEIVCALGLREQLVGVTHECDFPPEVASLPKVTRTLIPLDASSAEIDALVRERLRSQRALYSLDLEALAAARPDLIVTQTLCDVCAVAEAEVQEAVCQLPGRPRVLNLEPTTFDGVLDSIRAVAEAAGCASRADELLAAYRSRIDRVVNGAARAGAKPRVTFLEWIDPLFSCGHWTPELIALAGAVDGHARPGERSRQLEWSEIVAWRPEVLLVACCGYSIERTRVDLPALTNRPGWNDLPCVRDGRVFVIDGSAYFSRPGPRLVDSLEIVGAHLGGLGRRDRPPAQ